MNEAMEDEFDTVAEWTAEAALELGPDHYIPAGCRGSGSPAALAWLVDTLALAPTDRMLDCGAGVGGPAAYAQQRAGVRPVLLDPERGACRAAGRLFGLPAVRADAAALPFGAETFDAAWCIAVLCTTPDQLGLLSELRRVLRPSGRLGLLVYTAAATEVPGQPEGNHFPTEQDLSALLAQAGFAVEAQRPTSEFKAAPPEWTRAAEEAEAELERRHGDDSAWITAEEQAAKFGQLLSSREVTGSVLALRRL
jgi:SAM-dependent methyltransferase